jgi:undecaprenyl diphosphate synthase
MTWVEARNLPRHVGIIMDGNGRWATLRGEDRQAGHKAGSAAVRRVVRVARRLGISALTLYAFSEQNWARPQGEVEALMGLLEEFLKSEREEILDNGIRLVAIGDTARLPEFVRTSLDPLARESRSNEKMTLALALSYGARGGDRGRRPSDRHGGDRGPHRPHRDRRRADRVADPQPERG